MLPNSRENKVNNQLVNIMEHLAARETDTSLRIPKTDDGVIF